MLAVGLFFPVAAAAAAARSIAEFSLPASGHRLGVTPGRSPLRASSASRLAADNFADTDAVKKRVLSFVAYRNQRADGVGPRAASNSASNTNRSWQPDFSVGDQP